MKEQSPKKFKKDKEQRVFVLISTVMTWAKTKPVDPVSDYHADTLQLIIGIALIIPYTGSDSILQDDPDVPFVETDYRKRKPHPNYKSHIDLEKEVIQMGKKVYDASGVTRFYL